MAVAALTMFAACDNSMYGYDELFPEEYKRVVCIKQEGKGQKELFNVGKEDYIDFTVLRSGGIPEGEAMVNVVPMTQEELSEYSTKYVAADASIYSLSTQRLTFKSEERYQTLRAIFSPEAIENCSQKIATLEADQILCMAFKIEKVGTTSVDKEKFYIIRELSVNEPQLNFNFNSTYVQGTSTTVDVNLPFANEDFQVDWTFDVKPANFAGMAPSKAFGNQLEAKYVAWGSVQPVVTGSNSMPDGEVTTQYTISLPAGTPEGVYDVQVTFGNAQLDGAKDMLTNYAGKNETYTTYIRFDNRQGKFRHFVYTHPYDASYSGLLGNTMPNKTLLDHTTMKFIPGSSWSTGMSYTMMFDNNVTDHWENTWGDFGWGPTTVPFNAVIDLGSAKDVTAIEYWLRDHSSYYNDTKGIEVYAAESADYSNPAAIQLDGLTYLGYYDFYAGHNQRVQVMEFPKVNTPYLVLRYTSSNRGNSVCGNELRIWN